MRKGHYLFVNCGLYCRLLNIFIFVNLVITIILIIVSAHPSIHQWYFGLIYGIYEFKTIHAWIIFFFTLSVFNIIIKMGIHKICEDIAIIIKNIED